MNSTSHGPNRQTIRGGWNYWSGVILALGLPVAILFLDPMAVVLPAPTGPSDSPLTTIALFGAISVGSVRVLVSPRVEVAASEIIIVNVFRTIRIGTAAIQEIDDSGFWLRIQAGGRWFQATGTEAATFKSFSPELVAAQNALKQRLKAPTTGPGEQGQDHVQLSWRRPVKAELILLLGWLVYAGFGIAPGT